jgi:hypothetical protein
VTFFFAGALLSAIDARPTFSALFALGIDPRIPRILQVSPK